MAIVSGYTITKQQYEELAGWTGEELGIDYWPDGSITVSNGDTIIIEFYPEERPGIMDGTAAGFPTAREDADDPLIMCEECGQDILQSTAHWHATVRAQSCADRVIGEAMAIMHCETCGHDFIAQFTDNVFCPECALHGPAEAARLHDFKTDDPLIMCEECGQDILQSTAHWHDTDNEGRVPLCHECHEANTSRDDNPND